MPGSRSIATVEGMAENASAGAALNEPRFRMDSRVLSGSMAPRPRDTWSDRMTPREGKVTDPTTFNVRAVRPVPTRTVSPMDLPNCCSVSSPISI